MAEEITDYNDEELTRKLTAKKRVRGLLIAINFVLFGYLAYQIGASIVNLVRTANDVEGIVAFMDKTQKESLEIYDKYIDKNKIYNADFAIYGDKVYFTEGNYNKDDIRSIKNVQLIKVETDKSKKTLIKDDLSYKEIGDYLSDGISLFNDKNGNRLEKGDYLFYHDYVSASDYGNVIKVTNQLNMKYEMYSISYDDGYRVKTTIYAYKNNPALVMNVDYVTNLPDNCYDVVIIGDKEKAESLSEEYKNQKVLIKAESEITDKEIFELKTNKLIKLIDEVENETRVTYSSNLLKDDLAKFEKDDQFIINNAGYAMSRGLEYEFNNEHYVGKMTYIIELENK